MVSNHDIQMPTCAASLNIMLSGTYAKDRTKKA